MKYALPLAALMASVALASGGAIAADGPLFRHAAEFFKFDGTEFGTSISVDTTTGADGALFYLKSVSLPSSSNTLYVTLFATGDEHGAAGLWLTCRYSFPGPGPGIPCRPSTQPAVDEAPAGWIALHKVPSVVGTTNNNCNDGGGGPGDCHDNVIAYSWCVRIPNPRPKFASIRLRMATSLAGQSVFIEKGQVYIDSSFIEQAGRCTEAPPLTGAKTSADGAIATTTRQQSK